MHDLSSRGELQSAVLTLTSVTDVGNASARIPLSTDKGLRVKGTEPTLG